MMRILSEAYSQLRAEAEGAIFSEFFATYTYRDIGKTPIEFIGFYMKKSSVI
jgi:hypothetical protein